MFGGVGMYVLKVLLSQSSSMALEWRDQEFLGPQATGFSGPISPCDVWPSADYPQQM